MAAPAGNVSSSQEVSPRALDDTPPRTWLTPGFNRQCLDPRFGDNLAPHVKTVYLAWKYGQPMMCRPFKGFEELRWSQFVGKEVDGVHFVKPGDSARASTVLRHGDDISGFMQLDAGEKVIAYSPYDSPFDEYTWRDDEGNRFPHVEIEKSPDFIAFLNKLIDPLDGVDVLTPPEGYDRYICLHYRQGGAHDTEEVKAQYPTKFLSLSFYADAVKKFLNEHPGKKVFCQVSTDSRTPEDVREQLREMIGSDQIDFASLDSTAMDAFWLMAKSEWDLFVRPDSQFSALPTLLSQPKKLVKPEWTPPPEDIT